MRFDISHAHQVGSHLVTHDLDGKRYEAARLAHPPAGTKISLFQISRSSTIINLELLGLAVEG